VSILIHVSIALVRDDRVLLVQEAKLENRGRWNLPGGHLEVGETIQQGACREALEETRLTVTLTGLVGIYTSIRPPDYHAIRYVFTAENRNADEPTAGDEILAVRWFSPTELETLPETDLVGGPNLRRILGDVWIGRSFSLSLLAELP
jgi:ADP-ribose pyrophosphatase YjhB (NUDIX family)